MIEEDEESPRSGAPNPIASSLDSLNIIAEKIPRNDSVDSIQYQKLSSDDASESKPSISIKDYIDRFRYAPPMAPELRNTPESIICISDKSRPLWWLEQTASQSNHDLSSSREITISSHHSDENIYESDEFNTLQSSNIAIEEEEEDVDDFSRRNMRCDQTKSFTEDLDLDLYAQKLLYRCELMIEDMQNSNRFNKIRSSDTDLISDEDILLGKKYFDSGQSNHSSIDSAESNTSFGITLEDSVLRSNLKGELNDHLEDVNTTPLTAAAMQLFEPNPSDSVSLLINVETLIPPQEGTAAVETLTVRSIDSINQSYYYLSSSSEGFSPLRNTHSEGNESPLEARFGDSSSTNNAEKFSPENHSSDLTSLIPPKLLDDEVISRLIKRIGEVKQKISYLKAS